MEWDLEMKLLRVGYRRLGRIRDRFLAFGGVDSVAGLRGHGYNEIPDAALRHVLFLLDHMLF
tara:strand:+ start:1023 stop:1208 length:186 start_codon:yes stop_codon:yes gene_type:complete